MTELMPLQEKGKGDPSLLSPSTHIKDRVRTQQEDRHLRLMGEASPQPDHADPQISAF